jgi:hypothetical protein
VKKFFSQKDGLLRVVVGWGVSAYDEILGAELHDFKHLVSRFGIPFEVPYRPSRDANSVN